MTTPLTFQHGYPPSEYSLVPYAGTFQTDPSSSNINSPKVGGNWPVGTIWVNTASGAAWILTGFSSGSAVWKGVTNVATGDVVGPGSSTDKALMRFSGTSGKIAQNSVGILSDAGVLTGVTKIGLGVAVSAVLTLAAGTATAGTAPLKFTSGTNLTSPEAGAVEFDGTHITYTTSTPTRLTLTTGPASTTDRRLAVFSGTAGGLAQATATTLSTSDVMTFPAAGGVVLTAGATGAERKGTFTFNGSGTHTAIATTAAVTGCVIVYTIVTLGTVTVAQAILTTISNGVSFTPTSAANNDSSVVNWAIVA